MRPPRRPLPWPTRWPPGETLWTIASAHNLTTRSFAAANGLAPDAQVIAGTTLKIPTIAEAAGALASAPAAATTAMPASAPASSPPPALGGYTVRPGDTLSALAASSRVPAAQIAQMNGLDPDGPLMSGTVIKLPTGAPRPRAPPPRPRGRRCPRRRARADPDPRQRRRRRLRRPRNGVPLPGERDRLAGERLQQRDGVLANARGVMQVMPGTWDYVQANLAGRRLDPTSASDNVGAGVLYLGQLLGRPAAIPPWPRRATTKASACVAHRDVGRDAALRRQRPSAARALRRLTGAGPAPVHACSRTSTSIQCPYGRRRGRRAAISASRSRQAAVAAGLPVEQDVPVDHLTTSIERRNA